MRKMGNKKKKIKFEKPELSPKTKKIVTTLVITVVVFAFFIWLGLGMYFSVPKGERGDLLPTFLMYAVFPLLIAFFGGKRIYIIINGGEDPDPSLEEQQENEESEDK